MSAIDDMPEEIPDDHIAWNIDDQWPCCPLCHDSAEWENGMRCICMGNEAVWFMEGNFFFALNP